MTDLKEIAARALGIVERLREYSPTEKAEVLAIAQIIINIELARANRAAQEAGAMGRLGYQTDEGDRRVLADLKEFAAKRVADE